MSPSWCAACAAPPPPSSTPPPPLPARRAGPLPSRCLPAEGLGSVAKLPAPAPSGYRMGTGGGDDTRPGNPLPSSFSGEPGQPGGAASPSARGAEPYLPPPPPTSLRGAAGLRGAALGQVKLSLRELPPRDELGGGGGCPDGTGTTESTAPTAIVRDTGNRGGGKNPGLAEMLSLTPAAGWLLPGWVCKQPGDERGSKPTVSN